MELQQWFMNWKMWECLCNIYNICHHLHGENDVILNIFCGRESSRWTPLLPLTVPWTFGGPKKTCCCWSQVWRGPQRWASLSSSELFYSCSCWVFVYILWCGDSENNLTVVSHYLQKLLNELISEGQRLFCLWRHEFSSFFYVLLQQWWYMV